MPASAFSSQPSASEIHGSAVGSPESSAASCCHSASPYSRDVATRSRSALAGSPNALPGSTPMPYRRSSSAASSAEEFTENRRRSAARCGPKSGYR